MLSRLHHCAARIPKCRPESRRQGEFFRKYLLGTNTSKLSPEMTVLKRRVVTAKAKKDAKKAA